MMWAGTVKSLLFEQPVAALAPRRLLLSAIGSDSERCRTKKSSKKMGIISHNEQLVDTRSRKAYLAIESGMTKIEEGLKPAKPNVDQLIALVNGVMEQYNAILALVTKDAKNPPFTPAISLRQESEEFQTVEHRGLF
jgi:hypothetical protein